MLIDAHAHLDLDDYANDRAETIARAKEAGVERIINVGVEPPAWDASLALARQYPGYIYLALGIHPNDIHRAGDPEAALERLVQLVEDNRDLIIGLGETGLDYYHDDVAPELQKVYFLKQIELARQLNLPLVIHCRDAMRDLLDILQQRARNMPIQMHCFSGTVAEAQECMTLGPEVYISLAGPVTFARAFDRHEVARAVPLDRLLVETDCPFLTPHPFRGRRNEPARVRLVAERIAALKGLTYDEVARQTGENVKRLFGT
jgi:TatD DNase family protein